MGKGNSFPHTALSSLNISSVWCLFYSSGSYSEDFEEETAADPAFKTEESQVNQNMSGVEVFKKSVTYQMLMLIHESWNFCSINILNSYYVYCPKEYYGHGSM